MGKDAPRLTLRHWLFQVLPPLIILVPLFATERGSAFVFLAGFFVIPAFISLLSILFKLLAFNRRKYFLLRPALTLCLFFLLLKIALSTYETALDEAVKAARMIHDQCNLHEVCPEKPDGWLQQGTRVYRHDLGAWFKYSATYAYDATRMEIRVYQGPDLGHVISGGVGIPFDVMPYVDH